MGFSFTKFVQGLNILPKTTTTASSAGDLEVLDSDNKLRYYDGSTNAIVPTVTSTDTVSNKKLVDNSTTIVDNSDNTKAARFEVSGVTAGQTRVLTVQDQNYTVIGRDTTDTLTNKTFDVDGTGNVLSNVANANIKSGAAIARNKTASGTADHVLINSGAGVMSSEAQLAVSRGGTNSGTALNSGRAMISSAGAIVESPVTSTEVGYLAGVTSNIQTQIDAVVALTFPSGVMLAYGGASAPSGFLLCDGSSVLRATYPNLFTAIGTTYGSVDGTHFTLPNTQGIFLRGAGSQTIGGTSYSGTRGTYQRDKFQEHTHNMTTVTSTYTGVDNTYAPPFGNSTTTFSTTNFNSTMVPGAAAEFSPNGTPRTGTETSPANVGVNYIIKT